MPDDIKQAIKEAVKALQIATQTKRLDHDKETPPTPNPENKPSGYSPSK